LAKTELGVGHQILMNVMIGKVIWFCGTNQGNSTDCVNWAVEELTTGSDSQHLRLLAALNPPLNDFEVKDYAIKALDELGIQVPSGDEAVSAYARSLVNEIIIDRNKLRENLKKLFTLCHSNDYQEDLYDFYLLHCAVDDLDYGDVQHYWEGANKDNIEDLIVYKCIEFAQ